MKSGVEGPTEYAAIFAFSFRSFADLLMAMASARWPEFIRMSGFWAFAWLSRPLTSVEPLGYCWLKTTLMPLVGAYSATDLATSSENSSSAESIASVVGLGFSVAAMSITPVRYLLAGERTAKVNL